MISFGTPKHHWNYFLAIEDDLAKTSRYVEFSKTNLSTYSIELTHLLLSASSEVDVIMKQLCHLVKPGCHAENINHYKSIISSELPEFISEEISIDRFGLKFKPWENWSKAENPNWWKSYNSVKHERNIYFQEANLQNTINAVGALLLTSLYYYRYSFSKEIGHDLHFKKVTSELLPESKFVRANKSYYNYSLMLE